MTMVNTTMNAIHQHKNAISNGYEKITTGNKHTQKDMVVSELAAGTAAKVKVNNHIACLKNLHNYIEVLGMGKDYAEQILTNLTDLKTMATKATQVASDLTRVTEHQPGFSASLDAFEGAIEKLYQVEGKVFFDGTFSDTCISSINGTDLNTQEIDLTSMNWTTKGLNLFAPDIDKGNYEQLEATLVAAEAAEPKNDDAIKLAKEALDAASINVNTKNNAMHAAKVIGAAQESVKQGMVVINSKSQALQNVADIVNNNRLLQQNIADINLAVDPIEVNTNIQKSKTQLEQGMCALQQALWMDNHVSDYLNQCAKSC